MKISRIFILVVFTIFLLTGYSAGQFLFQHRGKKAHEMSLKITPNTNAGGQVSIWLITVDRLDKTTPKIIGIWLLAYIPSYTKIKPLPLYPSVNQQFDVEIIEAFHLTSDRKIAPEFWDLLQKHNHFVRDYIVLDQVAAANILNMYGGVTLHGKNYSGQDALVQLSKTGVDSAESIQNQVVVLDCICKSILNSSIVPDMDKLQKEIGKHIVSNLDLGIKLKYWQTLIVSGEHIVCDFADLVDKMQITPTP